MTLILGIITGLIMLTVLVGLHELGHALAAKKNGVKIEEYALGFPPNIFKFKAKTDKILPKGTDIAINWIPLGGYVKLQGEFDSSAKKGDYGAASFWSKTQILFAGVVMNWLTAIVLFTILAWIGLPKMLDNQFYLANDARLSGGEIIVTQVVENLPAAQSGVVRGDQILKMNGKEISSSEQVSQISKENAGRKIAVEILREGKKIEKTVEIRAENNDGNGYLGVATDANATKIHSTWSAPLVGAGVTLQLSAETFRSLGEMLVNTFTGLAQKISSNADTQTEANHKLESAGKNVAGPVSILGILFPAAAEAGFETILLLTALISLSLACMNVLPIPVLDGGRWLMAAIFRIIKKPLTRETEEKILSYGLWFMLGLTVLVIGLDLIRIF
ncbi:MAG: M50 family metallopeptidase [bacterium]|nr:M50 family metallopeptidase [bacterium]